MRIAGRNSTTPQSRQNVTSTKNFLFAWIFFLKFLKVHTSRGFKVSNSLTVEAKIYPSRDNYQI
jgi:hypothetical protein